MNPSRINIRYLNVQHWTDEKNTALINHLTATAPEIILITSVSRLQNQNPIKIYNYNTFAVNKNNKRNAGCAIAIKRGIIFKIINNARTDWIAVEIQTKHGPIIISTAYSPPRMNTISEEDLNFVIRNQIPTIVIADLNARHHMFGYGRRAGNLKGRQLYNHIYNNRLNHLGPTFNTFFTRNSETKPDIVLTNNRFFFNHRIISGGIGPSDHITMDIQISALPIIVKKEPYYDIDNTNWDQYRDILENTEEIDLQGKTTEEMEQEFTKLYEQLQAAKDQTTPLKTMQLRTQMKPTAKFKRLTKILDRYYQTLVRGGKTEQVEKQIRDTQLLLIQEGNYQKNIWWEEQIQKIEIAAKDNNRFWKQIDRLMGEKRQLTPNLKYKENGIEK